MPKPNHDFLKTWGVIIVTILIQVGMWMARDGRLHEDVKQLLADVVTLKEFKASYTSRVENL